MIMIIKGQQQQTIAIKILQQKADGNSTNSNKILFNSASTT